MLLVCCDTSESFQSHRRASQRHGAARQSTVAISTSKQSYLCVLTAGSCNAVKGMHLYAIELLGSHQRASLRYGVKEESHVCTFTAGPGVGRRRSGRG